MHHGFIWGALPCVLVLCCTVEDRPLEIVTTDAGANTGGKASAAGNSQGATTTDAGEGNQAGEAGTRATGGSSVGGGSAGSGITAGSATGGTVAAGGTTTAEGGAGELPEGQGTDCALPSPSCFAALPAPSVGGDALIDDFEDGNFCAKQHLRGYWFPFGANQYHLAIAQEGHASSRSLELSGNEHAAVALRPDGAHACDEQAFDLSSYTGIKFWAKVVTGNVEVNVAARDAGTESGGGEFATTVSSPLVLLSKSWQQLTVPFSTMKDTNQRLFDPSTTVILKLQAPSVDPPSYVVLFDDVTFY